MDHVLIDLGDRGAADRPSDAPLTDTPPRWRTRGWSRRNWQLAAVALALLVAATVTASRRAPELREVTVLTVEEQAHADLVLDGTALYLSDSPITGGGGELRRYGLADGRLRWRLMADRDTRFNGVMVYAGQLVVTTGICPSLRDAEVLAVDRDTGRVRWRRAGRPVGGVVGTGLIVLEVRRGLERCGEPPQDPVQAAQGVPGFVAAPVEVVDLATGATRWSFTPAPGTQVWYHPDPVGAISQIVSADVSGAVQTRDAATGLVTATARVPEAGAAGRPALDGPPASGAWMAGDLLLIPRHEPRALTLTAYSPDSLTQLWSAPVVTYNGLDDHVQWYTRCDRYLCVQTSYELVAVDPANGSTAWRLAHARVLASGSRWLVISPDGQPDNVLRLVDGRDGSAGPALTGYQLNGWRSGKRDGLVLGSIGGQYTLFSTLDLATGELRFLGRAHGGYDWCQATTGYLACLTGARTVRVWRLAG